MATLVLRVLAFLLGILFAGMLVHAIYEKDTVNILLYMLMLLCVCASVALSED